VDLSGCRGIAGSELESFLGPVGADRRWVHDRFFVPPALLGKLTMCAQPRPTPLVRLARRGGGLSRL